LLQEEHGEGCYSFSLEEGARLGFAAKLINNLFNKLKNKNTKRDFL
jgi:hypothetical protein